MSETLRIIFYTDSFLPAVDGVVTSITAFKKELENRGHEVYIVAVGDKETKRIIKGRKDIFVVRGLKFRKYPQYKFAVTPFVVSLKLRKLNPDIVHLQTPFTVGLYGLMYSRVNKYPIVGSFHTMFNSKDIINQYLTKNPRLRKFLIKYSWEYLTYFYNKCDATITPSEAIKKYLSKKKIKNISVIPNGIDTERFNKNNYDQKLKNQLVGENSNMILYLGRISKEKNIDILIKAAKYLKENNTKFIIGGTGPMLNEYKNLVNKYNLNDTVKFQGFISNEDLPKYYATADALCLPSTFETQGIVSLEALASGTPVVGADYLALKNIIENGKNGELFKPGNSKDCAIKLEKVINNRSSYKKTVQTAKKYSINKMTDKLLNLYKSVLNEQI